MVGREEHWELGAETIHFKLARINKRVLQPCDPKVCQSCTKCIFKYLFSAHPGKLFSTCNSPHVHRDPNNYFKGFGFGYFL